MLGSEEEEDHCFYKMARFIILFFSFYYAKNVPFDAPPPTTIPENSVVCYRE
jgi:hypothetical protein